MFTRAQIGKSNGIDTTVRAGIPYVSPTWKWVLGHKNGSVTSEEYKEWYVNRLDEHREEVLEWVSKLKPDDIFLCYCRDGDFCHTYLLIEWLEIED